MLEDMSYLERGIPPSWSNFLADRWAALGKNPSCRAEAVRFLADYTRPQAPALQYLFSSETGFLHSHTAACPACKGRGPRTCGTCGGRAIVRLPPLSIWAVELRNALRGHGLGEPAWPVWSLDDYLPALLKAAVWGENALAHVKDNERAVVTWDTTLNPKDGWHVVKLRLPEGLEAPNPNDQPLPRIGYLPPLEFNGQVVAQPPQQAQQNAQAIVDQFVINDYIIWEER